MRSSVRSLACLAVLALLAAGCEKAPLEPVIGEPVSAIVISPVADTLDVGETVQFNATVYDTLGQPTNRGVTWISGNTGVFTVVSTGRVRGVGEGTAPLIAAIGSVRDTAWVTVLPTAGGWSRQTSNTTAELNGIFFLPDGRTGWAVGAAGVIVHTDDAGETWDRQTSNTSFTLNGVWFTSPTDGYVVGNGGTILATTNGGTTWSRLTNVGVSDALLDVYFASPDTGWVVGDNGLVLRTFDEAFSWDAVRAPTSSALEGVAFAGTLDGWAVGEGGVIAGTHDRGVSWFVVSPSVTIQSLKGVARLSESRAIAVGDQGVTPRTRSGPDSTEWVLDNAGSQRQLEGVHFATDQIGFAVGFDAFLGGIVLRSDDGGQTWDGQPSSASARLNDVFFVDHLRGWAVGQAGTIVHTGRGGEP